ncbi:MAG: hypothetical protein WBA57_15985 [Elainellaceae cyanobacterium]
MMNGSEYIQQSAAQFEQARSAALEGWQGPCHCPDPGRRERCQSCPAFRLFIRQMQQELSGGDETLIPLLLMPKDHRPDENVLRQQCEELFRCGHSLEDIRWMTGANSLRQIRQWLRQSGLMGGSQDYEELRPSCIQRYRDGLEPRQIEKELGVPTDVVGHWVSQIGESRPKRQHTEQEKQRCIDLYLQGNSFKTVEKMTQVPVHTIKKWVKEAKVKRPPLKKKSGRPPVHSLEFRQACLDLLAQGYSMNQVAQLKGVSSKTICNWKNKVRLPPESTEEG